MRVLFRCGYHPQAAFDVKSGELTSLRTMRASGGIPARHPPLSGVSILALAFQLPERLAHLNNAESTVPRGDPDAVLVRILALSEPTGPFLLPYFLAAGPECELLQGGHILSGRVRVPFCRSDPIVFENFDTQLQVVVQ
jgi:hypothetical protein